MKGDAISTVALQELIKQFLDVSRLDNRSPATWVVFLLVVVSVWGEGLVIWREYGGNRGYLIS